MDDGVGDGLMPENAIESTPLQNKESEHSLKASSSRMVDRHEMVTPCNDDHHASSSHMYTNILNGKSLDRIHSSEHASASPRCRDETGIMIEELTLRNYNRESLVVVGTSNNRDRVQTGHNPWQHLYQLAGEAFSGSTAGVAEQRDKGWAASTDWEDTGFKLFPGFVYQTTQSLNDNAVMDSMPLGDGKSVSNNASFSPGGIRTKILSNTCFSEYFVKDTLDSKGVICKGPAHQGPARECKSQILSTPNNADTENSDAPLTSAAQTVLPPPCGFSESLPSLHSNATSGELSLREWLIAGLKKVNKYDSLHIFRQIVELVDFAHSQGVVLLNLQPSCFKLSQSNQVIYVGPIEQAKLKEQSTSQDVSLSYMNKRRLSDQSDLSLVRSGGKKPRYIEGMGFASQDADLAKIAGPENSLYDCDEEHATESNFKARNPAKSDTSHPLSTSISYMLERKWYTSPEQFNERVCTFSSNIYSLGVLLFELLGSFDSGKLHAAAMRDLQHRILPPGLLSQHPREAGFCLWLLHPEPSSRPTTRDILRSEVISAFNEVSGDKLPSSIREEDADSELLLHFVFSLKEQKEKDASKLVSEIGCIEADLEEVEKRQSRRLSALSSSIQKVHCTSESANIDPARFNLHHKFLPAGDKGVMLMRNIRQLESAYFSTRSNVQLADENLMLRSDRELLKSRGNEYIVKKAEGNIIPPDRIGSFFDGLCKYARYSAFKAKGLLRNADFNNLANVICSLSFDRDEDYLAAGGVSKKIKIFEFQALFDDSVDIHYPVVEMPNKSKLSCLCWNSYIRNYLASTDYDGVVKLWDASTGQAFTQFAGHAERAWSVDFSRVDPTKLASGSDDRLVKLWSLNERKSLCAIKNNANVCCVQFSADSAHLLAFSSADYRTYCYDLRNTSVPWCILAGHQKSVSYAKFLDAETIITASTDNTLKIWDLNKTSSTGLSTNACVSTLRGHTNEKNFVGLSVSDGYIVCGSETNEVYTYHRSLPIPITSHNFGSIDPISGRETDDDNGQFVSSVCWRRKSDMVVAANSSGSIKLLQMV